MNDLQSYYNIVISYLNKYLPSIPEFQCSKIKQGDYNAIIECLDTNLYRITIDTKCINYSMLTNMEIICHELAHMFYWNHNKEHEELTEIFTNYIMSNENLKNKKLHELEVNYWKYEILEAEKCIKNLV